MSSTTLPPALHPALLLRRLQSIAEETRLHLVQMLAGGERCVCELQDDLGGAAQSRLSFHLRKLKEAGVVSDRKEGRWVYYTLVPGALDEMRDFLGELAAGGTVMAFGGELAAGGTVMAFGGDLTSGPDLPASAPALTASGPDLPASAPNLTAFAPDLTAADRDLLASDLAFMANGGGCCAPRPGGSSPPGTGCC